MIRIITDSVASVPAEKARELGITVVSLYVRRGAVEYVDATMDVDAFYTEIYDMVDDLPTSSQPSQAEFEALFEEAACAGDEVLGVFISTGLSGTYEGALRCARAVQAHHLDFKYALIDSASCGGDEMFPLFEAVRVRDAGGSLQECADAVLAGMESTRFLFTPETLTFLQKGGRIGNAAALLGNLIQLAPVLTVTDGMATTYAKVRTRKKALEKILTTFKADVEECGFKNIVVHYIGDKEPAVKWARDIIEPLVGRAVEVLPVSPVVGMHVGPAVGIAYECARTLKGKFNATVRSRLITS